MQVMGIKTGNENQLLLIFFVGGKSIALSWRQRKTSATTQCLGGFQRHGFEATAVTTYKNRLFEFLIVSMIGVHSFRSRSCIVFRNLEVTYVQIFRCRCVVFLVFCPGSD